MNNKAYIQNSKSETEKCKTNSTQDLPLHKIRLIRGCRTIASHFYLLIIFTYGIILIEKELSEIFVVLNKFRLFLDNERSNTYNAPADISSST